MRQSPIRYLLWVLLPVGVGAVLSQHLASRAMEAQGVRSTTRMGRLAARMISVEMGTLAGELSRTAPLLTDPDLRSPLLQAAGRGDTIAALGSSSERLTLSVALAEEEGDSLRIRATTAPFSPATLDLLRQRTGTGVALYLRGMRVLGAPEDFGPTRLGDSQEPTTLAEAPVPPGMVLLPLVASGGDPSPAQLLVGPLGRAEGGNGLWAGLLFLLLAWGGGILTWVVLFSRDKTGPHHPRLLMALPAVPLLVLWFSVFWAGNRVAARGEETQRGDMVRVLALSRTGSIPLSPGLLQESTGFEVVRSENGEVTDATLPVGPLLAAVVALPLPPPTFPALGTVRDGSREMVYANLREGPGQALTLLVPPAEARGLLLLLAVWAGAISLTSLGFLLPGRAKGKA